ncbi:hypothetical protein [Hydrogenophaga sp.]|uniref:hypothetical protein n=1 Tax=Hydrogenophaga sp. TaxID=1904254 RepID=UPI003F72FE6C
MTATQINEIAGRLLAGKRKVLFGTRPMFESFEPYRRPTDDSGAEILIPWNVEALLAQTGYGDIAEVLSFRFAWMHVIDRGQLTGHLIFAQDDGGMFPCP